MKKNIIKDYLTVHVIAHPLRVYFNPVPGKKKLDENLYLAFPEDIQREDVDKGNLFVLYGRDTMDVVNELIPLIDAKARDLFLKRKPIPALFYLEHKGERYQVQFDCYSLCHRIIEANYVLRKDK